MQQLKSRNELEIDENYLLFVGYNYSASGFMIGNYNLSGYFEIQNNRLPKEFKDVIVFTLPDAPTRELAKARVRFYPVNMDETFEGTVIDETGNSYVVIPDYNSSITQKWAKKRCDVIS